MTRVLEARGARAAIAAAAGVSSRGLDAALHARRGPDGTVVVEYRAERSPRELRRVTAAAAAFLADAIAASDLRDAEQLVAETETRADRAATAVSVHEAATGVVDPDEARTTSKQQLVALQLQRDEAVAAGSADVPVLEEQVATAQQETFDLEAVAARRADLVDAQQRAVVAVERAEAARRVASERVGSGERSEPRVAVDEGTTELPAWRVVAAGLVVALGVGAIVVGAIGVLRTRRSETIVDDGFPARDEAPSPSPSPQPHDPAPDAPERTTAAPARIELAEIERRLAALERRTEAPGDVVGDHRIDQRS